MTSRMIIVLLLAILPLVTMENTTIVESVGRHDNVTTPTPLCRNGSLVIGTTNTTDGCDDIADDDMPEPSRKTARGDYVGYVIVPLFFILGLCGNTLSVAVMISKKFRNKTSSLILIALSVSDSVFACITPFNKTFLRNLLGFDVRALSSFGCSLFFIVHKTSKMSSSWFVVFISFERFVAIVFPLKTKFICTKRNTIIGIAVVFIGQLIFNSIWDFNTKIVDGICIPNYGTPETAVLSKTYLVIGTFLYSLLPVGIMLVLTPITVFVLVRHHSMRRAMSKSGSQRDDTVKLTTMLIGVTIAFIILVTPISIAHNVSFALGENIFETQHFGMMVAREILQVMEQLNYSVNFLLYVMCSQDFRKKVAELLCQLRGRKSANVSQPKTASTTPVPISSTQ
ncbi:galanin-like G-protein coupled receptor npr-9 [Haliotis rufescens]|uniref:galanin-like G-protein coupled receptor npr-9 n=1 Tax=Haliotis rufescens TaxID=6454 RepID=UPI00201F6BB7|nr:galanin-like G-protein coupled receptor npr-9 [Haliotis rufescens]